MLGCLDVWFSGCLVDWMLGFLVAWLLGVLVAWLLGCLDVWLLGCLVALSVVGRVWEGVTLILLYNLKIIVSFPYSSIKRRLRNFLEQKITEASYNVPSLQKDEETNATAVISRTLDRGDMVDFVLLRLVGSLHTTEAGEKRTEHQDLWIPWRGFFHHIARKQLIEKLRNDEKRHIHYPMNDEIYFLYDAASAFREPN